jgi:hypothetical protein
MEMNMTFEFELNQPVQRPLQPHNVGVVLTTLSVCLGNGNMYSVAWNDGSTTLEYERDIESALLKDHIAAQHAKIATVEQTLALMKAELRELNTSQLSCNHTFSPPVATNEREGGYCTSCGINESFAATLARAAGNASE